jgi:Flp pilus assembly protein TadG
MRASELLKEPPLPGQRGSAAVETVVAMALMLLLVLAVIEIAFALYGRNVVHASAHEGARAAVELGRSSDEARAVAAATVRDAAGGLVGDLDVAVEVDGSESTTISVLVRVRGTLRGFGPVPVPLPVSAAAVASRPRI